MPVTDFRKNILTQLPFYTLLKASGPDTKKFLQGQLTCDIDEITDQACRLGAHCNPQGRIVFLFRLFSYQGDYYFFLPKSMLEIALTALKKYAVFFKVELEEAHIPLYASCSSEHKPKATAIQVQGFSPRYLIIDDSSAPGIEQELIWNQLDITEGIPAIYPQTSGKLLPHELNMHRIQGISFKKGCYTGQEIIARMQHRGSLKTHMYRAKISSQQAPVPGQPVYYQEENQAKPDGMIVDAYKAGYNSYEVLLTAGEKQARSQHLFLDTIGQPFTFLDLPYTLN